MLQIKRSVSKNMPFFMVLPIGLVTFSLEVRGGFGDQRSLLLSSTLAEHRKQ